MLYVVEVPYEKENLPIIDDIWHLLSIMSIATEDYEYIKGGLSVDGELMQFEDLKDFRQWVDDELDEDPMYLVIDTKKKSVYYYEVLPTFKFTKMDGNKTFAEIQKEKENLQKEVDKRWKDDAIMYKKKDAERLDKEIEHLKDKKQKIDAEIKGKEAK